MRNFRLLSLVLLSVFAMGAIVAASVSALPVLLPKQKEWKGKGAGKEKPALIGAASITCGPEGATSSTGTEEEGKESSLGLFHIDFTECEIVGFSKCNSLGDNAGVILTLGSWHLVWDTLKPALGDAILFLPEHLAIACGAISVLVLDDLVCLLLEDSKKVEHLFHCNVISKTTTQEDQHYWDGSGTEHTLQLLCSVSGGTEENCGELALGEVIYKEANEVMSL